MSIIGVSPSDIVKGIELAIRIKQTWFEKTNRADTLYREFGEDVSHLANGLQALSSAFQKGCDVQLLQGGQFHNPRDEWVDRDRRALVGNFEKTLAECEELLVDNANMGQHAMAFLKTPYWHLAVMPKVNALRDRIKFHMIKLEFIMQPLKDGLLKDISMSMDINNAHTADLHALLIQGVSAEQLRAPSIPAKLYAKFNTALEINRPSSLSQNPDRKIEVLFEALHRSFLASTFAYHGPSFGIQTIQQYLNLIKAQFLLDQLQQDHALWRRYYYARSVRLLELRIREQFRRRDIERYSVEELDKLAPDQFQIWEREETIKSSRRQGDGDVGVPLDEILLVHLVPESGNSPQDLAVMRHTTRDHEFRLIRMKLATTTTTALNVEGAVNIHNYRFIPWFGIPTSAKPSLEVEIRDSSSMDSLFYTFRSINDLEQFQHAMLGYHVVCNKTSIRWKFHSEKEGENTTWTENRIQLWRPKRRPARKSGRKNADGDSTITAPTSPTSLSSRSPSMSTMATTVMSYSSTPLEKLHRSSTIASSIVSETPHGTERGVTINNLPSPVLFIFTLLKGRYTFLHFTLEPRHHLSYQCKCPRKPHTCSNVAIKLDGKDEFTYRIFSVPKLEISNWDLALFCNPQHPRFVGLSKQKTRYLDLQFSSSPERIEFATAFNKLIKQHADKLVEIEHYNTGREQQSHRPEKVKPMNSGFSQRSPSVSSVNTTASARSHRPPSVAPSLDPIPSMPALSLYHNRNSSAS